MEPMLDVQSIKRDEKRQKNVIEEVLFNDKDIHAKLNEWKYVNGLTYVQDRANNSYIT
jgi:hypothetical protein